MACKIRRLFFIGLVAIGLLAPTHLAAGAAIPPPLFVKIVLATLAFDRNLDSRYEQTINIAVVGKDAYSKQLKKTVTAASRKTIKGHSLKVVDAKSKTDFNSAQIVIFGESLGGDFAAISSQCKTSKITCVAVDPEDVNNGLTLGVEQQNGKPKLLINLKSAAEVGADYSSQILRLARVVE